MSYYVNPQIPEGLTEAEEGHGRSFLAVLLKYLALVAVFLIVIDLAARFLAPLTPFGWERRLVPEDFQPAAAGTPAAQVERELSALGQKVARVMNLPEDMTLTFHYVDQPLVNALATLGGHIVVFRGLLESLESEDALAAVLAHEIGHVKNRDMLKGLVRAVSFSLFLGAMDSSSGASAVGEATGGLGLMKYSRGQESRADQAAVLALGALYGHSQGLEQCFNALQKAAGPEPPEILSSHPDTGRRLKAARQLSAERGLPADGRTTPLAGALALKKR